jgi:stearoyl-CoA desaturase (delta-9 desaturase)
VNSLAHYLSEQPYDNRRSSSDHFLTAIITIGRVIITFTMNFCPTIEWHQPDLTKWFISLYGCRGLAYSLNRQNEIDKTRLQQVLKKLNTKASRLIGARH